MSSCKVISEVVEQGLCIGCGLCVSACGENSLEMSLNKFGFLEPKLKKGYKGCCSGKCIAVCPFNPEPTDSVRTEDQLSQLFLEETSKNDKYIGSYINTYAGYSYEHRLTSSSGGVATYTLIELFKRDKINHVISVKNAVNNSTHYEYSISSTIKDLKNGSKTKYFPVTLANVFEKIDSLNGNVAVVGVPCFIKAIRLAQNENQLLKKKINFVVGIICGGVKSTFFTEYLASKAGCDISKFSEPEYRIKDTHSSASDYSFGCLNEDKQHKTIKMKMVGDMWGTGLFKSNACDFCDDVSVELADISLGDAWIEPFRSEGEGTNVIVTRSKLAEDIIKEGTLNGELYIEDLTSNRFIESQRGGYNHRHGGIGYRIQKRKSSGLKVPPKRFENSELSFLLKLIHKIRMRVRSKSLQVWYETKDAKEFDKKMKFSLQLLKFVTKVNHLIIRFKKKGELKRAILNKMKKVYRT